MLASASQDQPPESSASDGSSDSVSGGLPRTPVSTSHPLAMSNLMNFAGYDRVACLSASGGGAKRTSRTTRRINTAERRATHNAVERQRRKTLNERFLELAALLSNLTQIRRPSRSAIINSSIAHLNASRIHRVLAAQQLRMIKNESDVLRREVNEWRARAGVASVDEPMRSDAFGIVIRGELDFGAGNMLDAGDWGEGDEKAASDNGVLPAEPGSYTGEGAAAADEYALLQLHQQQEQAHAEIPAAQMRHQQQQQTPFAHTVLYPPAPQESPVPMNPGYREPAGPFAHYYTTSPTIVKPVLALSFENPTIGYDHPAMSMHAEVGAKWAYKRQH
ncbi:hypothetical protein B0H14DRAFT_3170902 [Mycena olivaceomarginata]|nr:hypothetical protein B0H14DRAFT_3170902 [Mycena olivaceomarginata]